MRAVIPYRNTLRADARAGFLLVEVLATMTISALLLAALVSIASVTMRTSSRIEGRSEAIENGTRILAALSRDIERGAPIRWAGKDAGFVFIGRDRGLVFASEVRLADGTSNIIAIGIDGGESIARRMANISPNAASFDDLAFDPPETIAGGRYSLAFAYYGRLPDGREALTDVWRDQSQLPVAVRLTLSDAAGTTTTLRVKLGVDAEPGCGFPKKGNCGLRPGGKDPEDPVKQTARAVDSGSGR